MKTDAAEQGLMAFRAAELPTLKWIIHSHEKAQEGLPYGEEGYQWLRRYESHCKVLRHSLSDELESIAKHRKEAAKAMPMLAEKVAADVEAWLATEPREPIAVGSPMHDQIRVLRYAAGVSGVFDNHVLLWELLSKSRGQSQLSRFRSMLKHLPGYGEFEVPFETWCELPAEQLAKMYIRFLRFHLGNTHYAFGRRVCLSLLEQH